MEIGQPEIFSEKMKKCQNPCKIKAFSTSLPVCGRIRTADPSLRRRMLYPLSYTDMMKFLYRRQLESNSKPKMRF